MSKGPGPGKANRKDFQERRARFMQEALRKRTEINARAAPGGRPVTIMRSSIDPNAVGTTLIVGKG